MKGFTIVLGILASLGTVSGNEESICSNLQFASNQYADLVEQQVQDNLPLDKVNQGVNFLKSLRGDTSGLTELTSNTTMAAAIDSLSPEFFINYGISLAPFSGPSFFFFVLTLLCCPFFFCARCCMANRCCKPKKALEEYGKCSRLCPLIFYFIFSGVSVILALIGIMQTAVFVDGMKSGYCTTTRMIDGVDNLIDEISKPINALVSDTNSLTEFTRDAFEESESIDSTVDKLIDDLEIFAFSLGNKSLPGNHSTTYFADKSSEVHTIVSDLKTTLNPIVNDLASTRTTALDTLESVDSSLDAVAEPLALLTEGGNTVSNVTATLNEIEPELVMVLSQTKNGAYVFYSTVFFGFLAGVLAVLLYFTPLSKFGRRFMTCSWCLTYLFTMFLFLLGGLLITISFVVSDTCDIIDPNNDGLSSVMGFFMPAGGDAAEAFNSCMGKHPKPLMQTLGGGASVNISEVTEVFGNEALNAEMDVSEFQDFVDNVTSLTIYDIGFPQTLVSDAQANLNAQTATDSNSYSVADCTATDSCDYDCLKTSTCASEAENPGSDATTLGNLRLAFVTSISERKSTEDLLTWMKTNVTALNTTASELNTHVNTLKLNVDAIEVQVDDFADTLDGFSELGNCSFVGVELRNLHLNICGQSIGGLTTMSISMFLVGLMGIPMIILSVVINIRFFGSGAGGFVQPTVFVTEDK